jgi:hypothetical protein
MGKLAPDAMIDAALAYVAASDFLSVCQDTPVTYADGHSHADAGGDVLAEHTMTVGAGNGDYTIADDTSGRKLTMTAQSAISILHAGTATHIALCLVSDTTLRYVTTCTSQALTAGGTVDVPAWKINIADPT